MVLISVSGDIRGKRRARRHVLHVPLDYTLARYKSTLHSLIYDHGKSFLVKNFRVNQNPALVRMPLTSLLLVTQVSRWADGFLLSTGHGCPWPSFGHQTWMADESRQLPQHSARHRLPVSTSSFLRWKHVICFVSGLRAVSDAEVIAAHKGTKLSVDEVGYLGMTTNMFQYVDIFSIPEVTLLRDVTQVSTR